MIIGAEKLAAFEVRLPAARGVQLHPDNMPIQYQYIFAPCNKYFWCLHTALATTTTGHEDECMIESARGLVLTRPGSKLCVALVIKCLNSAQGLSRNI